MDQIQTPQTFYAKIFNVIIEFDSDHHTISGDWKLVQNPELDLYNYKNVNNPKAREIVLQYVEEEDMFDPWRNMYLTAKRYTWRLSKPIKQARLDSFLLSRELEFSILKAGKEPVYRLDHSIHWISLKLCDIERGRSFRKFNNSLLSDRIYVETVKEIIKDTTEQYKIGIDDNGKILLCVDDQLFFETVLLMIRGYSIKYSSERKKEREQTETKLKEKINNLQIDIDTVDDFDQKNKIADKIKLANLSLESLNKFKTEGIILRAKSEWKEKGEKTTKYFLPLETRNYLNKTIAKLETMKRETITDTKKIISETKNVYKNLYTKQDCTNINLLDLFQDLNIPKFNEIQKYSPKGKLQYDEVL